MASKRPKNALPASGTTRPQMPRRVSLLKMEAELVEQISERETVMTKLAHHAEDMSVTLAIDRGSRLPEVGMQNVKGSRNRPRVNKFTVATCGGFSKNTIEAFRYPLKDGGTTARPEKAKSGAMKSLVFAHMAG